MVSRGCFEELRRLALMAVALGKHRSKTEK
jgi:hypothetical protein